MVRRALAGCAVGLGMVSLMSLVGAKGAEEPENVVTVEAPSLEVVLELAPGAVESELELRVRINPPVATPPVAELHDAADKPARAVDLAPSEPGVWVGTLTQVELFGLGHVQVTATAESGKVQRHRLSFATRGTSKNAASVAYSADGRFGLLVLPDSVPEGTRFLVTTHESADPPLPPGVVLEAGPFRITATEAIPEVIAASVVLGLGAKPDGSPAAEVQVRLLNPATATWDVLPSGTNLDVGVLQAYVSRPGTFVLTSGSPDPAAKATVSR